MKSVNKDGKPTLRRRQAEATRELIADAALELFQQEGYTATTIEAIASRSGVAVSTVYFAFGSKREILRAIRGRWHRESHIKDILERAGSLSSPDEKLDLLAHGIRRQWESGSAVTRLYRAAASADREAARELREAMEGRRAALDGFVSGLDASLKPGMRPADAAAIVRALCRQEVYEELVIESGWTQESYEMWLAEALKRQLLGERGGAGYSEERDEQPE